MNEKSLLDDLKSRVRGLGIQIASIMIDSVFLSLWVVTQYLVGSLVIRRLGLSGIHQWMLLAFQVIFALSTLIPVIVYIYVDLRVMIIRARRQVRRETQLDEIGGNNDE